MLDYDKKIKIQREKSINEVVKEIKSRDMIKKINNYCEKWDDDYEKVEEQILTDKRFRRSFVKDVKKTNIYEKEALNYLQNDIKLNIDKLPARGKNAICLKKGKLVSGSSDKDTTKSIDLIEIKKEKLVFYLHKYINEEGGAQCNQYRDVVHFLNESELFLQQQKDTDIQFKAILDGKYFDKRINKLQKEYKNIEITTINDIER